MVVECRDEDCIRVAAAGLSSTCNLTYVGKMVMVRLTSAGIFG
jgi:hypothetical protein